MATHILLTVDTELAWRHYARGAGWQEIFQLSYDPAGVGVPYQLEQLRRHGLRACFFVDPMPALHYGLEPIRRMVGPILDAGQEVQLHLHSLWFDLSSRGERDARFELTDFDAAGQADLIATARDLLVAAGAPLPIAFRSGSYAADAATLAALRAIGIRYDSSHNGAEHPWPSALPFARELLDPAAGEGVCEIPISAIKDGKGRLRPLQLCALSTGEMQAALQHGCDQNHPLVTLVSHSFELATRDGRRVNRTVRHRFDALCAFLGARREEMPTSSFATLDFGGQPPLSRPMLAHPLRKARRLAEQLWSDACYERPATATVAIGGPTLMALDQLLPYVGF